MVNEMESYISSNCINNGNYCIEQITGVSSYDVSQIGFAVSRDLSNISALSAASADSCNFYTRLPYEDRNSTCGWIDTFSIKIDEESTTFNYYAGNSLNLKSGTIVNAQTFSFSTYDTYQFDENFSNNHKIYISNTRCGLNDLFRNSGNIILNESNVVSYTTDSYSVNKTDLYESENPYFRITCNSVTYDLPILRTYLNSCTSIEEIYAMAENEFISQNIIPQSFIKNATNRSLYNENGILNVYNTLVLSSIDDNFDWNSLKNLDALSISTNECTLNPVFKISDKIIDSKERLNFNNGIENVKISSRTYSNSTVSFSLTLRNTYIDGNETFNLTDDTQNLSYTCDVAETKLAIPSYNTSDEAYDGNNIVVTEVDALPSLELNPSFVIDGSNYPDLSLNSDFPMSSDVNFIVSSTYYFTVDISKATDVYLTLTSSSFGTYTKIIHLTNYILTMNAIKMDSSKSQTINNVTLYPYMYDHERIYISDSAGSNFGLSDYQIDVSEIQKSNAKTYSSNMSEINDDIYVISSVDNNESVIDIYIPARMNNGKGFNSCNVAVTVILPSSIIEKYEIAENEQSVSYVAYTLPIIIQGIPYKQSSAANDPVLKTSDTRVEYGNSAYTEYYYNNNMNLSSYIFTNSNPLYLVDCSGIIPDSMTDCTFSGISSKMINNLTSASTNITYTSAMSKTSIPIMNNTTNDIYADCNLYDFYQILSGTADILSETLILSAEIA